MSDNAVPENVELHRASRTLTLTYSATEKYDLPCEYLRVYSPSAEVKGHGPGQEVLQIGKKFVGINAIQTVGNYALQFTFSDGHDTGIYSWKYLYELCQQQDAYWKDYLERMEKAGKSREPDTAPMIFYSAD